MSKIGSAASEEKPFENVNGRTDGCMEGRTEDGRNVITIAHPEQSSGELKNQYLAHMTKTLVICKKYILL